MAAGFESDTHIELLLKKALLKEGIAFEEQYRIYSGGRFSTVKYVADFFIPGKNDLIIECDGFTYHADNSKKHRDKERDIWLANRGYIVLRYTTKQLKYRMNDVVKNIVDNMDSSSKVNLKITYSERKELYPNYVTVALFIYYIQKGANLVCVYKFKSITKNTWSDERTIIIKNVPEDISAAEAVYCALLDLKVKLGIKVFFNGELYKQDYSSIKTIRMRLPFFKEGSRLLHDFQIVFEYCNIAAFSKPYYREDLKTINELKSRCRQIGNQDATRTTVAQIDYGELVLSK